MLRQISDEPSCTRTYTKMVMEYIEGQACERGVDTCGQNAEGNINLLGSFKTNKKTHHT